MEGSQPAGVRRGEEDRRVRGTERVEKWKGGKDSCTKRQKGRRGEQNMDRGSPRLERDRSDFLWGPWQLPTGIHRKVSIPVFPYPAMDCIPQTQASPRIQESYR